MTRLEEFMKDFENRSSIFLGGYTTTLIKEDDKPKRVRVKKTLGDLSLTRDVSLLHIEYSRLSPSQLATLIRQEMKDDFEKAVESN